MPNISFHSGHDINIFGVLHALGSRSVIKLYNRIKQHKAIDINHQKIWPDYGSTLILERQGDMVTVKWDFEDIPVNLFTYRRILDGHDALPEACTNGFRIEHLEKLVEVLQTQHQLYKNENTLVK